MGDDLCMLSRGVASVFMLARPRLHPLISTSCFSLRMITQTAEYALRAVVYLSQANGPCTSAAIAAATHVPAGYMSKVLQSLSRAGIVSSQRGLHGGFVLRDSPHKLTALTVINAVEPIRRYQSGPSQTPGHHLQGLYCKLDSTAQWIEDTFKNTSIAELDHGSSSSKARRS